jgi:transcriptional regulator with XRE-family HTH domain
MSQEPTIQSRNMTLADFVAANVRAELAARRLTANDLAKCLNIGPRAAARRLSGELDFSLNETDIVARWFGVARSELMRERVVAAVAS